jgi:16S rRNA (cytosine967-C5)-methyltransferase
MAQALRDPQAQFNHPLWWIKRLQRDWPEHAPALLAYNAQSAPLTLRIFEQKQPLPGIKSALNAMYSIATEDMHKVANSGLQLPRSLPVSQLPGYAEGAISVQDAAAQLAAPLLLNALPKSKGQALRILDACAAPGGKTTHLLEWAALHNKAIEVTALDVDPARCEIIHENLQRLGLQAKVIAADAAEPSTWHQTLHQGLPWDGILLDAPCTASGIVRRHPDIPWQRRESDIAALAAQQKRLLTALWPLLSPGGALLYCTCSVFKAEGQDQIEAFVAHNKDAFSLPAPGHLLPLFSPQTAPMPENPLGEHDGFFYALLRKAP